MKFKYSKDGTLIISLGKGCPFVDFRDTPYYVKSGDVVYQDYLTLRNVLKLGAQYVA